VHEALLAEIYQVQSAIGQMTGNSEVIPRQGLPTIRTSGQQRRSYALSLVNLLLDN
jgi:hypothetical protein